MALSLPNLSPNPQLQPANPQYTDSQKIGAQTNWAEYGLKKRQLKEAEKQNKWANALNLLKIGVEGIQTYNQMKENQYKRDAQNLKDLKTGVDLQSKLLKLNQEQQTTEDNLNYLNTAQNFIDAGDYNGLGSHILGNVKTALDNKDLTLSLIQTVRQNLGDEAADTLTQRVFPDEYRKNEQLRLQQQRVEMSGDKSLASQKKNFDDWMYNGVIPLANYANEDVQLQTSLNNLSSSGIDSTTEQGIEKLFTQETDCYAMPLYLDQVQEAMNVLNGNGLWGLSQQDLISQYGTPMTNKMDIERTYKDVYGAEQGEEYYTTYTENTGKDKNLRTDSPYDSIPTLYTLDKNKLSGVFVCTPKGTKEKTYIPISNKEIFNALNKVTTGVKKLQYIKDNNPLMPNVSNASDEIQLPTEEKETPNPMVSPTPTPTPTSEAVDKSTPVPNPVPAPVVEDDRTVAAQQLVQDTTNSINRYISEYKGKNKRTVSNEVVGGALKSLQDANKLGLYLDYKADIDLVNRLQKLYNDPQIPAKIKFYREKVGDAALAQLLLREETGMISLEEVAKTIDKFVTR